ncbi:type 1 glutamine amidotransferase [Henriciella litoralis]|uniref:type 1 glutamine amidotransferase n=1 Tax=Henriciella litoralis TaxID=568102 RepID=UPI000A03C5DB|nr:type 1 glutamine amidotransferase [Henriciella litoralis]
MKLTILETGLPPEAIRADWPRYPAMFESLIKPHMPGFTCESVAVSSGDDFPDLDGIDAILVTGSAAGVYEQHPWMGPLLNFIQRAAAKKTPQIGVCFGHQAIAKALGGRVEKSDKGWGLGRHVYDIIERPDWMGDYRGETFSLGVSHQDQVLSLPPGAQVVARSDFTPFAVLDYGAVPAISFQGHPEFSAGFCNALYNVRRGTAFSPERVDAASKSLETPVDNDLVGKWMANFLKEASHRE